MVIFKNISYRKKELLKNVHMDIDNQMEKNEKGPLRAEPPEKDYGSLFSTASQLTRFHQFSTNLARSFL